jgi:hypothetical protein
VRRRADVVVAEPLVAPVVGVERPPVVLHDQRVVGLDVAVEAVDDEVAVRAEAESLVDAFLLGGAVGDRDVADQQLATPGQRGGGALERGDGPGDAAVAVDGDDGDVPE